MATPHNAAQPGDVKEIVLMPGDPLRAQYIAEHYLDNLRCFNTVRGMLGYTGVYRGKELSVMASGMGCPSMGIYSYELYHEYGVEAIIRVGSAGGFSENVHVTEVIAAIGPCTNSNYGGQFRLRGIPAPVADYSLLRSADEAARKLGEKLLVGSVLCSDTFYSDDTEGDLAWNKLNVLAVEMESAALYLNAARAGKKALCLLTVSDHLLTGEALSAEQRQTGFDRMIAIALETAVQL